jgi:prepilin-type N-terminal cleavage/methylation domain-containing protein
MLPMKISQQKLSNHHPSIEPIAPILTLSTKAFQSKKIARNHHRISGFTLIELLMAMSIMAITATLISYAVSQMIASNQKLGQEQNRRVEVARALDMIASDIKISKIDTSGRALPTGATITGTVVLDMDVEADDAIEEDTATGTKGVAVCTAEQRRIIYSVKPNTGEVGQSVIYRYGLISQADGKIHCKSNAAYPNAHILPTDNGSASADAISIENSTQAIPLPTCGATERNADGFYTCTKDNQVSIVIYTATQSVKGGSTFTNTKTYAIARNVVSGESISPLSSTPELCDVPQLVGFTKSNPTNGAEAKITAVKSTTDPLKTLRSNAIRTEVSSSGDTVTSQSPLAGNKLPCDSGLVIYTY